MTHKCWSVRCGGSCSARDQWVGVATFGCCRRYGRIQKRRHLRRTRHGSSRSRCQCGRSSGCKCQEQRGREVLGAAGVAGVAGVAAAAVEAAVDIVVGVVVDIVAGAVVGSVVVVVGMAAAPARGYH